MLNILTAVIFVICIIFVLKGVKDHNEKFLSSENSCEMKGGAYLYDSRGKEIACIKKGVLL